MPAGGGRRAGIWQRLVVAPVATLFSRHPAGGLTVPDLLGSPAGLLHPIGDLAAN